jgi:hypothetical protein
LSFDINASEALMPGVAADEGAEEGADMAGHGEGQSRFCELVSCKSDERCSNRGVGHRDRQMIGDALELGEV